jgi:hypothetical protein
LLRRVAQFDIMFLFENVEFEDAVSV